MEVSRCSVLTPAGQTFPGPVTLPAGRTNRHPGTDNSELHPNRKSSEDEEDEGDTEDSGISGDSMESCDHRQSQLSTTLNWLTENYERSEGVCLPRCTLYAHYLDFCKKRSFSPAGAATFGKIIRQRFPKLTTRRLGTRGQSKYHYYGIGIKETSVYYHSVYTGKGLTRFSGTKIKTEGSNRKYSLSSKAGTLLPEFPDTCHLVLPEGLDVEKVQTFIVMYRTHCQRILDTVISANFEEVQNFLLHFWQGMPDHLIGLLTSDVITDIVGVCDSVLYRVLSDVIVPSTIQDLPDSLGGEIRAFVKCLPAWLASALEDVPDKLRTRKLQVVQGYVRSIKRQISFVHLAQTARSALVSQEVVSQMVSDLGALDLTRLCCQAAFTHPKHRRRTANTIHSYILEFKALLMKQATIECFTEWLDNVIDTSVLQLERGGGPSLTERAAEFVLLWSACTSLVMRDLTLHSAKSFGPFHLLHMMFLDYVLLVVDTQQAATRDRDLTKAMTSLLKDPVSVSMETKVRQAGRIQLSPRSKRRRVGDDNSDETVSDDESVKGQPESVATILSSGAPFSQTHIDNHQRISRRCPALPEQHSSQIHDAFPVSPPVKQGHRVNTTVSCERSSYPTCSNYMTPSSSLSTNHNHAIPDMQAQSQGFNLNAGTGFPSAMLQSQTTSGSYWNESQRGHVGYGDPYPGYSAYKPYPGSYDTLGRGAPTGFFRPPSCYQDSLSRTAFDHARGIYQRTSHDVISGTSAGFAVTSYTGNYVDVAPPVGGYGRQDSMTFPGFHQEDYFSSNLPGTISNITKSYIAPFR